MPTGNYTGTVTFSAAMNSAPAPQGTFMQEITASNCPANRTMAIDARNNRTYWVRRVGSLCWMETNLAYAGGTANGGDNRFGDAVTGLINSTAASFNSPHFTRPAGDNPTTAPTLPSTSTTGTGQFGYLYNWCAAMGGQALACQNTNPAQPDQRPNNGTDIRSICPLGWRLPTDMEQVFLNSVAGGGRWDDIDLSANSLFMRAGAFFGSQGVEGYYWSSTADSASSAAIWRFNNVGDNDPGFNDGFARSNGFSVRCVAD